MIPSFNLFPNPGDQWIAAGVIIAVLALGAYLVRKRRR
jgi:LPXTG-motif cell wall-anchored protein